MSARTAAAVFAVFSLGVAWATRPLPGPVESASESLLVSVQPLEAPASVDKLTVLRVAQLSSSDRRFGGLSDLRITAQGDVLAVSDQGYWVTLAGLSPLESDAPFSAMERQGAIAPLRNPEGAAIVSKNEADAEGLAVLDGGSVAVSFEGRHRIDIYPLGSDGLRARPSPGPALRDVQWLGRNQGLEALARLPDGRLAAGAESGEIWLVGLNDAAPAPMQQRLPLPLGFALTAFAPLGDQIFMTWRAYNPATREVQIDVRQCPLAGLLSPPLRCGRLALLKAPFPVDNIEGISARWSERGVVLDLLSDDNYSGAQRTILMTLLLPVQP